MAEEVILGPVRLLIVLTSLAALSLFVLAALPWIAPDEGSATEPVVAGGGVVAEVPAADGPVRTQVTQQVYAVTGASAEEILTSMQAASPRFGSEAFFGLTATELSFRYVRVPTQGRCSLRDVGVDLAVTVTLPEWTPPAEAEYDLRRDWSRFASSLRRHEDQHRVLAHRGAVAIQRALTGVAAPTCGEAEGQALRLAERLRIETEAAHRRYDDETGHGRTQGAVWPRT